MSEPIFQNIDLKAIPWWTRLCLWFCKPHYSVDGDLILTTKRFRNIIYVVGQGWTR